MEVHIYSVKAMSEAGNIWVKDIITTQNVKVERKLVRDLARKFSRGPLVQDRALLELHIFLWEYTLKVATTLLSGSRKGTVGA